MSAPEPQVTAAAIDVLYDFLWEPDDATPRDECARVIADILRASNVVLTDTLRELVERWRAKRCEPGCEMCAETDECADELEAAMGGDA